MTTRTIAALLIAAAAAFAPQAPAQDETRIATVQAPAWVERDGRGIGARPGLVLQAGDVLRTGPRGRVHIDTPDGSIVKLGSDGTIGFNQLALRAREQDTVFEGVMNVVKGAFRFTTRLAGKANRRDVRVRVGVVTAGVRGTDIWGKSDLEKDLVCLLEGTISVTSDGAPEQTMSEAMTFYVVPHGAPPNPIAPVDPRKVVDEWAPQTEMAPDGGAMTGEGRFKVVLMSRTSLNAAEWIAGTLNGQGYPAEVAVTDGDYGSVFVRGFATRDDAQRFAAQVEGLAGVRGAFVSGG
jgi:cell division septation protein DedD